MWYTNDMLYALIIAAIVAADQLTKLTIRAHLAVGEKIPVIGDWFNITFVKNSGTAFSMFSGNRFVTVVLTTALIVACLVVLIKEAREGSKNLAMCLTCVMAGGIGNMIDRLSLGYVTDMLSFGSFAVFNVADIFVTCGCFIAILVVFLDYRKEEKK